MKIIPRIVAICLGFTLAPVLAKAPWGTIESYDIFLQPPDSVVNLLERPSRETEWHFFGQTHESIDRILDQVGLIPASHPELARAKRLSHGAHMVLLPSDDTVANLAPESRRVLCRELASYEDNYYQRHPVVFEHGDIKSWFENSELRPDLLPLIEQLSWPDGPDRYLTDVPFLLGYAKSAAEEQMMLRAVSQRRTTIARLKLTKESDLATITNYWSAGAKAKDVLPLLESIARNPEVERLDLAHLLPPTPRKHLNLFPILEDGRRGRFPDAYWTALNFLNFYPAPIYQDTSTVDTYVRQRYRPLDQRESFQFGDLILVIRQANNRAVHSCVYLADNLVYTKNGSQIFEPWVVQTIGDMLAHHRLGDQLGVVGWRDKTVPTTSQPAPMRLPDSIGNLNGVEVILP
ncbi:MAG: hypothetical protein ACI8UO_006240 [Verrucomicrobiales bacterium]|jgi:hypothetical protein